MGEWEKFLHDDPHDRLVQLAIAHAEFESLHPFLDGNGRLGRMLVPLFLWQHGLIHQPMFYLSAYLEQRRDEYYDRLLGVSRDGDWTSWCVFFLTAVQSQAIDNLSKAQAMLALYDELKPAMVEHTHSQYAIAALDWIFGNPIFSASHFAKAGIPAPTAKRILRLLRDKGLIVVLREGGGRRPAIYSCPRILNVAEGYEAFSVAGH
jgi:Fic family protein